MEFYKISVEYLYVTAKFQSVKGSSHHVTFDNCETF